MRLENKVAVVTGAASGIGAACATRFAQEGARVVLADIDVSRGEQITKEINARHESAATFRRLDVTDAEQWTELMSELTATHETVDTLVACADLLDGRPAR